MELKSVQEKKGVGCFKIFLIIIFALVLLIGGLIFYLTAEMRRSDKEILKTYQPTPEIAEIAEKNTLTDKGKATFYRSQPELVEGEIFRKYCFANGVEALGCNAPKPGGGPFGGRKIFLLKIDDSEFADHKFSAAVHEMLHSVYMRLGKDEKKSLVVLLDQELSKRQDDIHLTDPINTIKKRKKNNTIDDIRDELHSKLGVEYGDILPELEEYYKQYFTDRSKIVELFQSGGFNSNVRRMDEIRYEIEVLAPQLTSMESQLTAYRDAGNTAKFNSLIGQYNNMISKYNALAAESQKIYSGIKQFYQYFNPDYQPPAEKKTE